ncbi:nucleotide exchange factor GrpE [Oryzobacter telluris]|uniref:nucleotide exchange factor GrpE n=1 Tax=Oryzobacter telluris TaxID=3149179 RepID=UPI00370CFFD0
MDSVVGWLAGSWLLVVVIVLGAMATTGAGVAGYLAGRRRPATWPAPGPVAPPPARVTDAPPTALVADTAAARLPTPPTDPTTTSAPGRDLVLGLIGAHDLAMTHDAVRIHVEQVLRRAGVQQVVAEPGEPFDPDTQSAVTTEPVSAATSAGAAPGLVAHTVRPGWRTASVMYRPTEVAVWTP